MIVTFDDMHFSIELLETIKGIISRYHSLNELFESRHLEADAKYKKELSEKEYTIERIEQHYADAIQQLNVEFEEAANQLNSELKEYISSKKKLLFSAFSDDHKPADYETKISNALKFLSLEGTEITDRAAHDILKDFVDDYDTMARFERVITIQTGKTMFDPFGHTVFPLTFKKLESCRTFIKTFDELSAVAESIFLNRKSVMEAEVLPNGGRVYTAQDSIKQRMDEVNSLKIAETLEEMIRELFITEEQ